MAIIRRTLKNLQPVKKEDLDRFDAIKDEDIDYSDILEVSDSSQFHPWEQRGMFKPGLIQFYGKL